MTWDGKGIDPWLPQRLDARVEVSKTEDDIRRAVWGELSTWLTAVERRMVRDGAPPDLHAVWALEPSWRTAVEQLLSGSILKALKTVFTRLLGRSFDWQSRPAVNRYLTEVRNRLVRVPDDVYDLVAGQVAAGVNLGEGIPELASRVDSVLSRTASERWPNRATTIARTETIGALNFAKLESFKIIDEDTEHDEQLFKQWLATEDDRTRHTHREADGQRVAIGQPFNVGGFELAFPGDPMGPPEEVINCVIGSTQVTWPGQGVLASYRRYHRGPFVKIITAKGHDLTVTPNHPVLTSEGYVPAGLLRPGQYVLATGETPSPEVDNAPPSIEKVHGALSVAGQPERVSGSRMDFHGDGTYSEVEVVGANRDLGRHVDLQDPGQSVDLGLIRPSGRKRPLSGMSDVAVLWEPLPGSGGMYLTARVIGRFGKPPTFGRGHPSEPDLVRLASSPDIETQLDQTPDHGRTAESDFAAHLQYALASGMAPTEIVKIDRFTSDHRVYNLSTSDQWFTGNGIALHNCRCTMLLVDADEVVDLTDRQMKR